MPLQNRVAPTGEIIATPARGAFMGNRGILHDANQRIVRSARNRAWLICRLDFKGRRREVMRPGSYTELFFLDEAVALAAGHRPCGECRRTAYGEFIDAVNRGNSLFISGAIELDRQLNASRRAPHRIALIADLPDGVFVRLGDDCCVKWSGALYLWTPEGYADANAHVETAAVLTPALTVEALKHGYRVDVHASVRR